MHTVRMDADTGRDDGAVDRYWRRRATVLAAVIGVLVALVYGCGDDEETTADGPADAPTVPAATPTVTVTKRVRASATRRGGACAKEDLVVGLTMTRDVFVGAQRPRFIATIVNVGPGACTFDGDLDVRVTSGPDRVWSSGRCARGGSGRRTLLRGVPHVVTVTWDRRRSPDDCRARGLPARPGTYVATARSGDLKPARRVFHLR